MLTSSSAPQSHCTPKAKPGRTLSLPVLPSAAHHDQNAWSPNHSKIKHSRSGRWRALVLILVHIVFLIHLAQWLITGLTVSPVEPSESMYALRDGAINAGLVFFILAILSTLLFGRFFCGWGCHVVALQDLCAWVMMRCGVKPKPFRSRLLLWVPVGLAIYMFAWPVIAREFIRPTFADPRGRLPDWLGGGEVTPFPGSRSSFLTTDFWETFAHWSVAIPFLFVCAVAAVYFLGAKAFCTYGCPYGGIFAPVDLLAVGKIKVNDNCEHCGHCTAVCTSNVRVHEEVRDFGMVVDPGCMKCMDCISVCPNEALSFGLATPTVFAKPRPGTEESRKQAKALRQARWDLSWPEEIACLVLFLVLFLCFRGMLNQVPMLMAVAMAFIGVWACFKSWRLSIDASSRVHGFQLKYHSKIRPVGYLFILATLASLVVAAWSGTVRLNLHRAQLAYQHLETPIEYVLRPDFAPTPDELDTARRSLAFYKAGSPPSEGGTAFFWPLRADDWINLAYLHLVIGDFAQAETSLKRAIEIGHPKDSLVFQLAQVMHARSAREVDRRSLVGDPPEDIARTRAADEARIEAMFAGALAKHDELFGVRDRLLRAREKSGDRAGALLEWHRALERHPRSIQGPLIAAAFYRDIGDQPSALKMVERALAQHSPSPEHLLQAASLLESLGQRERAATLATRAATEGRRLAGPRAAAAQFFADRGFTEPAHAHVSEALSLVAKHPDLPGRAGALLDASRVQFLLGRTDQGLTTLHQAAALAAHNAWDLGPMAQTVLTVAQRTNNPALTDEALRILTAARDAAPPAPGIRYDLAQLYYFLGRHNDALNEMRAAADLAPANFFLAYRYAELLQSVGRTEDAKKWQDIALQRARNARPG